MVSRESSHSSESPVVPPLVFSAGSRLRGRGRFFREAAVDVREMWPAAKCLFRRHLAQQYRFSSLGLIWACAPAVATALVLVAGQRTHVIDEAKGGVPAAFYGVFGLTLAQTFLDAITVCRRVFIQHQPVLRRQNVPLEGFILAALLEAGFNLLVRLGVLAVMCFLCSVVPTAALPLALWGMGGVLCLGAGCGLLLSPLNSLGRDIDNLMALFPWLLFAVTPVFVPVAPGSVFARIHAVNPLAWLFDGIRAAAYGGNGSLLAAACGPLVGVALLIVGWLLCRLARPFIVERMVI